MDRMGLCLVVAAVVMAVAVSGGTVDPGILSITFTDINGTKQIDSIDKCDTTVKFLAFCKIPDTYVDANTNITATTSAGDATFDQCETTSGFYSCQYTVSVHRGQRLEVTCGAKSLKSPRNDMTVTKSMNVYEPPYISMGNVKTRTTRPLSPVEKGALIDGDYFQFHCNSFGGYSEGFNMTAVCGNKSGQPSQNQANVFFRPITEKEDGMVCRCLVDDVTSCIPATGQEIFKVLYPPAILDFQGNSMSQNITVASGTRVTFTCKASGNPAPKLTVWNLKTGKQVVRGHSSTVTFNENKLVEYEESSLHTMTSYDDMGEYSCHAFNDVKGVTATKSLFVYLELEPQIPEDFILHTENQYRAKNGGTAEINIPVQSYPAPSGYTLTQINTNKTVSGYNATFTPGQQPPNGTVSLSLVFDKALYDGAYLFTIHNGMKNNTGASYSFNVLESKASSSSDDGLSDDAKAGIGIGVTLAIVVLCVGGFVVYKRVSR